jgi:hypothetical protein
MMGEATMMRAVVIGLAATMAVPVEASAEVTTYRARGKRLDATLTITTDKSGKAFGRYEMVAHGCIGEVSGEVVKVGPTEMMLSARLGDSGFCKVRITRRDTAVVTREDDSGNCSTYFRGASCAFGGLLKRVPSCSITQATLRVKDDGTRYAGQKVERPDLIGKTFRVTRYTEQRKRHLSSATGDYKLLGYEGYEIKGDAGTFHIKRDHVDGSPAVTPLSWAAGTKSKYGKLKWGGGLPERVSVGQSVDYLYDGPLTSLVLEVSDCQSVRGKEAAR